MDGALGSTRMGSRSSTRYGPASVFQGRVRRWKKSWAPMAPSLTPSAAACRVLLYKWTPVTLPTGNATKESTPEELLPVKPVRFLPVSVLLQQRKEEAQKAAEESEALARLELEAEAATNPTVATDGAEAIEAKQVISSTEVAHIVRAQLSSRGDAQSEETASAKVTESADQGVGGDAEANRTEPVTSSQNDSTAAPKEEEAASMDVDQSK